MHPNQALYAECRVQRLGAIKHEPDHLRAWLGGSPPRRGTRPQRGVNGASRILGRELDLGQRRDLEPGRTGGGGVCGMRNEPSLNFSEFVDGLS